MVAAIARREIAIASRSKLVRILFLFSILPAIVMGVVLVVRVLVREAAGMDLGWDPVFRVLQFQAVPVGLLALGLGTPSVARDRSEDVLYLYAVRPVLPWHYALGKMMAVAVPCLFLLFLPGLLIAVLRQGILGNEVGTTDSAWLMGKVLVVASFMSIGFSGLTVGSSAIVKRARWALLVTIGCLVVTAGIGGLIWGFDNNAMAADDAVERLLEALFEGGRDGLGVASVVSLTLYGLFGFLITMFRVRTEMTP